MAKDSSKRKGTSTPHDHSSNGLGAMTEGTDDQKPSRRRNRSRRQARFAQGATPKEPTENATPKSSIVRRGFEAVRNHRRLAPVRGWVEGTGLKLKAVEQRLPSPLKKPIVRRSIVGGVVLFGSAFALHRAAVAIDQQLPDPAELTTFARPETLTIRASDGTILHQLGPATRQRLPLDKMPKQLVQAFVASEDRRFYDHDGVDLQAIGRAVVRNFTSRDVVEGGSTLTQQLARMVYLNQDQSFGRKFKEALIAQKLERNISKQQLLEQYLNLVFLGSNAYGVTDAAWVYFSKSPDQLTLSEMATIAGLPPAPSLYSPLVDLGKARERRDVVLDKMVVAGYITEAEAEAAKAEKIAVKPSTPKNFQSQSPYFTYYVQQQLPKYVSPDVLKAGGITVETTLNAKWQKAAEKAIKSAIEVDGNAEGFKQAALIAIDPRSGEIRSMVGGYDFYKESQFNRATQAQRQPGSTFKPFVYATGIAAGFSPARSYLDERFTVDGYQPKNYSNKYSGWMSISTALTNSVNVVAVKTLIDVGFDPVIKMAQRMGIRSKLNPTYSLALGAYEVNLLEITSAYGSLAAQGNAIEPHAIRRVLDRKGKVLYDADFKPKRAIDPGSAALTTAMMRGVVSDGTGRAAQLDRPVAGKTGTSEQARDLWFIGFVPQLVTGVWLGNDDNAPTWGTSGTAAYTWHEFMNEAVKGMAVQKFPTPPEDTPDRKGSIKAKPVEPRQMRSLGAGPDPEESGGRRRYDEAPAEPSYSEPAPEPQARYYEPAPRREPPPEPAPQAKSPEAAPLPEPAPRRDPIPPSSDPLPPSGN